MSPEIEISCGRYQAFTAVLLFDDNARDAHLFRGMFVKPIICVVVAEKVELKTCDEGETNRFRKPMNALIRLEPALAPTGDRLAELIEGMPELHREVHKEQAADGHGAIPIIVNQRLPELRWTQLLCRQQERDKSWAPAAKEVDAPQHMIARVKGHRDPERKNEYTVFGPLGIEKEEDRHGQLQAKNAGTAKKT